MLFGDQSVSGIDQPIHLLLARDHFAAQFFPDLSRAGEARSQFLLRGKRRSEFLVCFHVARQRSIPGVICLIRFFKKLAQRQRWQLATALEALARQRDQCFGRRVVLTAERIRDALGYWKLLDLAACKNKTVTMFVFPGALVETNLF